MRVSRSLSAVLLHVKDALVSVFLLCGLFIFRAATLPMISAWAGFALLGNVLKASGRTVYNVTALAEPAGKPVDLAYLRSHKITMFETGRTVRRTPRSAAEGVAALLRMHQYDFAVGGAEYTLFPFDRLVAAGGRCLGRFAGLGLRGDTIILRYAGGDLGAGGARYSAVVEIGASESLTARKALLSDTGSFHFSLRIPELLEDTEEVSLGIVVPRASEKTEGGRAATNKQTSTEKAGSQVISPLGSKLKKKERPVKEQVLAPRKRRPSEDGEDKEANKSGSVAGADKDVANGDESKRRKKKPEEEEMLEGTSSSDDYSLIEIDNENFEESNGNSERAPL